jgi:hypothetical protein
MGSGYFGGTVVLDGEALGEGGLYKEGMVRRR